MGTIMQKFTFKNKKKNKAGARFLGLICVFCLLFTPAAAEAAAEDLPSGSTIDSGTLFWPTAPEITSEGAILMEAGTGAILYEKNSTESFLTASTTKLMTLLLALENSALGEVVTVSHDAVYSIPSDSSRIWVDEGEQLSMKESLYALMLPSANDMAYAIAEHIGGSIEGFAAMMNRRASELGCVNSLFVNPHGYDEGEHHSCPADLAKITQTLLKYPNFTQIAGSKNFKIAATNLCKEDRWIANTHLMIRGSKAYDGVIAGKTGHTDLAGSNLVTVAKRGNLTLIAVLLKADNDDTVYAETASLFDYGFDNFGTYNISGEVLNEKLTIPPLFTSEDAVQSISGDQIVTVEAGSIVLPNSSSLSSVSKKVTLKQLSSFQNGRNKIGRIDYSYGNHIVGYADLVYDNKGEAFTVSEHPISDSGSSNPAPTGEPGATPSGDGSTTPSGDGKSPSGDGNASSEDETSNAAKKDVRPLIIGLTFGVVSFLIGAYVIFVELPYRRKKKEYLERKKNRKHY